MRRRLAGLAVLVTAVGVAALVIGCAPPSSITGRILADGQPVPNAAVNAYDRNGGFALMTVSEADGTYTLAQLPPGAYRVRASIDGWSPVSCWYGGTQDFAWAADVTVVADGVTVADIHLPTPRTWPTATTWPPGTWPPGTWPPGTWWGTAPPGTSSGSGTLPSGTAPGTTFGPPGTSTGTTWTTWAPPSSSGPDTTWGTPPTTIWSPPDSCPG